MGSFLKRYADHYPFRAEHKGGSRLIRPKNIIVTSNYEMTEIWPADPALVAALTRRYKILRFNANFPAVIKTHKQTTNTNSNNEGRPMPAAWSEHAASPQ